MVENKAKRKLIMFSNNSFSRRNFLAGGLGFLLAPQVVLAKNKYEKTVPLERDVEIFLDMGCIHCKDFFLNNYSRINYLASMSKANVRVISPSNYSSPFFDAPGLVKMINIFAATRKNEYADGSYLNLLKHLFIILHDKKDSVSSIDHFVHIMESNNIPVEEEFFYWIDKMMPRVWLTEGINLFRKYGFPDFPAVAVKDIPIQFSGRDYSREFNFALEKHLGA